MSWRLRITNVFIIIRIPRHNNIISCCHTNPRNASILRYCCIPVRHYNSVKSPLFTCNPCTKILAVCCMHTIDQIIGNHLSDRVTFDLNLLKSSDSMEGYYEIIHRYLQIFDYVKKDETTEVYTASNLLPFTLYSEYEYLSKFRLCRWIYQNGEIKTPNSLRDMQVEDRIVSADKKLCESVKKCRKTHFIWDTNIFYSFVL